MSILDGPLEYVARANAVNQFAAYAPTMTPAELQLNLENDDPVWWRDRSPKPRFRVVSGERMAVWNGELAYPHRWQFDHPVHMVIGL